MLEKKIYESCIASRHNPFVYKGYFLDEETGFYYLKSRYCDPTIRKFISIDSPQYIDPEDLSGLNLYAYCGNNPVILIKRGKQKIIKYKHKAIKSLVSNLENILSVYI